MNKEIKNKMLMTIIFSSLLAFFSLYSHAETASEDAQVEESSVPSTADEEISSETGSTYYPSTEESSEPTTFEE